MARGKRRSIDDLIAELDAKIEKKQRELSTLKDRRKELEASNQVEMAAKVVQLAAEKGVSIERLLESLE